MATIALPRPVPPHRASSGISSGLSSSIPSSLSSAISTLGSIEPLSVAPVPNKHIPVCPPGPTPVQADDRGSGVTAAAITAAAAAAAAVAAADDADNSDSKPKPQSLLYPPDRFARLASADGAAGVYLIEPADVAAALDHIARQPLPDPLAVFPWYHGLHPSNHIQQAFFVQRRRALRRTPSCLRGVALVKADGDLGVSRLKGAIAPQELLQSCVDGHISPEFLDVDPREGFSVRNFQIQAAKAAMTSDVVVYGDDEHLVRRLGQDIATAQTLWRQKHETHGHPLPEYNTFVCLAAFAEFEANHPEIVAVDSAGRMTGNIVDLFGQERREMCAMAAASEISHNVWMGPTPDPSSDDERRFDILIECSDIGRPNPAALQALAGRPAEKIPTAFLEFPASGSILPPMYVESDLDGIINTCKWIYHLAHGTYPSVPTSQEETQGEVRGGGQGKEDDGWMDVDQHDRQDKHDDGRRANKETPPGSLVHIPPRKILIHCQDGYTESTLLGIAYFSYSMGMPLPEAWLKLHTDKGRNFFAYPTDVALLTGLAARLLSESPVCAGMSSAELTDALSNEPKWLSGLDGSFPSRILDYMYLGNLGHANNPDLLRALGIGQILSVGETAMWRDGELEEWGIDNVCTVQGVQDNGIDPLMSEIERCLEFIDRGHLNGTATLVHCRVGVSRSATICIAEVMRSMGLSFPRAYSFVRARRLNVIIQPHLRFAYELLKWEELLQLRRSREPLRSGGNASAAGIKRELEWGEMAREIALMNRPYAR